MRKRYLIVSVDMGDSAPGTVFKVLSKAMSKYADIDVISSIFDPKDNLAGIRQTKLHRYHLSKWKTTKRLWKIFHLNLNDLWWIIINLYKVLKDIHGRGGNTMA